MRAVIVTGDRNADYNEWWNIVDHMITRSLHGDPLVVIHGGATGIDSLVNSVRGVDNPWISVVPMPAQWDAHGKKAGPMRNRAMLNVLMTLKEHGYDVAVFAFHDNIDTSRGTKNMVNIALNRGVRVLRFDSHGDGMLVTERIP
jgi:hypothetical protein